MEKWTCPKSGQDLYNVNINLNESFLSSITHSEMFFFCKIDFIENLAKQSTSEAYLWNTISQKKTTSNQTPSENKIDNHRAINLA